MTRNEAKNLIIRNNAEWFWYETIDKIFDEHEELIKPKSCDDCMFDYCGCSVQDSILRADNTATFETFCCNRFKQKDNA